MSHGEPTVLAPAPFIVLGAPRSGTTYLQSLIDADPRIVLTNETRVFTWLHRSLHEVTGSDRAVARKKGQFLRHLRTALPQVVRTFYAGLDPDAVWWGDKNPFYSTEEGVLETIDAAFPGTRYVHIIRDGRDVVTSLFRRRNADGTPWASFDDGHRLWLDSLRIGRAFGTSVGDRYLELRYEDLVQDDEGHLRAVMEHLGAAPSDESLALARRQRDGRTPVSSPTRVLHDASSSSWSQTWSAEDQVRSLDLLAEPLIDLRYETAQSLTTLRSSLLSPVSPGPA